MGYTRTLGAFRAWELQDGSMIPPRSKSAGAFVHWQDRAVQPRRAGRLPFRLAVINDEITPDFERACQIVFRRFRAALDLSCARCGTRRDPCSTRKEVEDAKKIPR